MTLLPLPCYPWPIPEGRLEALKVAKALLDTPTKIKPVEAVAGVPGRVLAWSLPPFICRYAPIREGNGENVESLAAALEFILGENAEFPSERFDEAAWLSEVMGGPVRYLHSVDVTGKVVFS